MVDDKDLRDENSEYFRRATDTAMMYTVLELSSGNFECVKEVLSVHVHCRSPRKLSCGKRITKSEKPRRKS